MTMVPHIRQKPVPESVAHAANIYCEQSPSWRLKHKLMQVMIEERLAQGKKVAILLVDMQPGFLDGLGPVSRYRDIMLDEGHTLDAMAGKEGIILIDVNMPDSDPTIGMLLSKAKKQ